MRVSGWMDNASGLSSVRAAGMGTGSGGEADNMSASVPDDSAGKTTPGLGLGASGVTTTATVEAGEAKHSGGGTVQQLQQHIVLLHAELAQALAVQQLAVKDRAAAETRTKEAEAALEAAESSERLATLAAASIPPAAPLSRVSMKAAGGGQQVRPGQGGAVSGRSRDGEPGVSAAVAGEPSSQEEALGRLREELAKAREDRDSAVQIRQVEIDHLKHLHVQEGRERGERAEKLVGENKMLRIQVCGGGGGKGGGVLTMHPGGWGLEHRLHDHFSSGFFPFVFSFEPGAHISPLLIQVGGLEHRLKDIGAQVEQLRARGGEDKARGAADNTGSGGGKEASSSPFPMVAVEEGVSRSSAAAAIKVQPLQDPHDRADVEKMVAHVQLLEATMLKAREHHESIELQHREEATRLRQEVEALEGAEKEARGTATAALRRAEEAEAAEKMARERVAALERGLKGAEEGHASALARAADVELASETAVASAALVAAEFETKHSASSEHARVLAEKLAKAEAKAALADGAEAAQRRVSELTSELEATRAAVRDALAICDERVAEATSAKAESAAALSAWEAAEAALETTVAEAEEAHSAAAAATARAEAAEGNVAGSLLAAEEAGARANALESKVGKLAAELEHAREAGEKLWDEVAELRGRSEELAKQLAAAKEEGVELKQQMEEAHAAHCRQVGAPSGWMLACVGEVLL